MPSRASREEVERHPASAAAGDARSPRVAVVVPAYRCGERLAGVLARMPAAVDDVVVVDDGSPDDVRETVAANGDPRVRLLVHPRNRGVGGAMKSGIAEALARGAEVVVKVDGDGQMDPAAVPALVAALLSGEASLAKGNRLFDLRWLRRMPLVRRVGNLALSFLVKVASGYWHVFDPCNGFVAVRADLLRRIPAEALADRYFFEISLLCEAYLLRAVVVDVPMAPSYAGETSSLSPAWSALEFLPRLAARAARRVLVTYFLRDFTVVSIFLLFGLPLFGFGVGFSAWHWWRSFQTLAPTPTGTIVLGALAIALGFELLLQALVADVQNEPRRDRP